MKVFRLEIYKDTYIYINRKTYDAIKNSKQEFVSLPVTHFETHNREVYNKIREQVK